MQYILTQQEYDALKREQQQRLSASKAELQKLATDAAMHIPVARDWAGPEAPPAPWGCILGPREQHPGYCDDCPAQKICPHEGKEWSQ